MRRRNSTEVCVVVGGFNQFAFGGCSSPRAVTYGDGDRKDCLYK